MELTTKTNSLLPHVNNHANNLKIQENNDLIKRVGYLTTHTNKVKEMMPQLEKVVFLIFSSMPLSF